MELKLIKSGKKRNPFFYIFLSLVLVVFLSFGVYMIADNASQIALKRAELDAINHEIEIQEMKNAELEAVVYSDVEYLKYATKVARENDYVKSGERVFINSSGD